MCQNNHFSFYRIYLKGLDGMWAAMPYARNISVDINYKSVIIKLLTDMLMVVACIYGEALITNYIELKCF